MRHVIAAAGLLALAACAQPSETSNGATAIGTAGAAVALRWDAENACALLDKATVGAALGAAVESTRVDGVVQRTDKTAGFSTCYYQLKDGQQAVFMARQSPVPDNTPAAMRRARDEMAGAAGPVVDVIGVGRSAFWVPKMRTLFVFLGEDRYFSLVAPELDGKDPKTIALGLATRVE